MALILIHKETGVEVALGGRVVSFRGDGAAVTGWDRPHKATSTGRIYVKNDLAECEQSYFPGVFSCAFVDPLLKVAE